MNVTVPELSLVVLIGSSGSGKSTFARTHFMGTEVLSSDFCRGLVSNDENSQAATADAFDLLHYIARKRLRAGLLTVIDATNVQEAARKPLIALARDLHVLPVAIVLDLDERVCMERNAGRPDRQFGSHVIRGHVRNLRESLRGLEREGFRHVYHLRKPEAIADVQIIRQPLFNNKKDDHGPFDIIGDVHGCIHELTDLLTKLGYSFGKSEPDTAVEPPPGRKAVFVGDLCDRGPDSVAVLKLVMAMVASGAAMCVPGNHDAKLLKYLRGKNVKLTHGLEGTSEQLSRESDEFRKSLADFLDSLISHYVFDGGALVVAHAGLDASMQGRASGRVRSFAMYGSTTGELDEQGLPERLEWAKDYRGKATVVYGHTPVAVPHWLNNTIDIDTGCAFGGSLTALRWPEREIVSVPAYERYSEPARPFLDQDNNKISAQHENDDVLDIEDVIGKRLIETQLYGNIIIPEENSIAALEAMSRFAINPKWLVYLPPTMSPPATSELGNLLEHPNEAFSYYSKAGITEVICEEKHMGSRCVVVLCKDEKIALDRFGSANEGFGVCYTRTGRRFFSDVQMEAAFLDRLNNAAKTSGMYEILKSDWVCLDCEVMPWSAKARDLIISQYAAVGSAATAGLDAAVDLLKQAVQISDVSHELLNEFTQKQSNIARYRDAYHRYCWNVASVDDIRLAPFHVLASEGCVHTDRDHVWHMETLKALAVSDSSFIVATPYLAVDLNNHESWMQAVNWWETLTGNGGEGMVVKPRTFVANGSRGIVQPAIKCRGSEYLRIIYGPDYDLDVNIHRLRRRGLTTKRSLALREFALGIEGLNRFVQREPLRRVHECVFGVLAMESVPVDPRL